MDTQTLLDLIPGIGMIVLAVLSGAGGSALLELLWKPRRARRTAAVLLYAEVLQNLGVIQLQAELRKHKVRSIQSDFRLSRMAWETASESLRELPVDLVRKLLLLYTRFDDINRCVTEYAETFDQMAPLSEDDPERQRLKRYLNSVIDVFNTGLDHAFDLGLDAAKELIRVGKIKEAETEPRDVAGDVRQLLEGRQMRLKALEDMD